jgi:hypothetical protein
MTSPKPFLAAAGEKFVLQPHVLMPPQDRRGQSSRRMSAWFGGPSVGIRRRYLPDATKYREAHAETTRVELRAAEIVHQPITHLTRFGAVGLFSPGWFRLGEHHKAGLQQC